MSHLTLSEGPGNRRTDARVSVSTIYSEYVQERQQLGVIVDVSDTGLRVQRPLRRSGAPNRIVQLEFELPGTGELIWAKGETCFDALWRASVPQGAMLPAPVLRTSGIRFVDAASKHLRLVRDFVEEVARTRRRLRLEAAMGRVPDERTENASYWMIMPPWVISPQQLAKIA